MRENEEQVKAEDQDDSMTCPNRSGKKEWFSRICKKGTEEALKNFENGETNLKVRYGSNCAVDHGKFGRTKMDKLGGRARWGCSLRVKLMGFTGDVR